MVRHPVRRGIIMLLMLLGNAGLVTAAATLIASFASVDAERGIFNSLWFRIGALAVGLSFLWMAGTSKWLDRRLNRGISWALMKRTDIDVRDYAALLHLAGEWAVTELHVEPDDWLAGKTQNAGIP